MVQISYYFIINNRLCIINQYLINIKIYRYVYIHVYTIYIHIYIHTYLHIYVYKYMRLNVGY